MSGFIVDRTSLLTIIEGMKGLNCCALSSVPSGTKKSYIHTQVHDGFFVPGYPGDLRFRPFFNYAVAGALAGLTDLAMQPKPATAVFSHLILSVGGLQSFHLSSLSSGVRAARRFFVGVEGD